MVSTRCFQALVFKKLQDAGEKRWSGREPPKSPPQKSSATVQHKDIAGDNPITQVEIGCLGLMPPKQRPVSFLIVSALLWSCSR